MIFAAASLADALSEVGAASGQQVEFNFAGSNLLAQQIALGAPADLFVAANWVQMERLTRLGKVSSKEVIELLGNTLVVVVPQSSPVLSATGARDLLRFKRLSVADPEAVPAGVYARQWLKDQGVWSELEKRVVPGLDVRATLAAVATGHLPVGLVYATDAMTSTRVRIIYRVPQEQGPQIRYYAAPLAGRSNPAAEAFLSFLCGLRGEEILTRHGFVFRSCSAAAGSG